MSLGVILAGVVGFLFVVSGFLLVIRNRSKNQPLTETPKGVLIQNKNEVQQNIIVENKQELDTEVAKLLADGWKVTAYRPKSFVFFTPEDFSNLAATVLERGNEIVFVRVKDIPLDIWGQLTFMDWSKRGLKRFVLGVLIAIVVILLLITILGAIYK